MRELNILIVEDKFIATQYLSDILLSRNSLSVAHIYTATNSSDAIEIVKNHSLDLIFMDINIKGSMDGITCSKLINEQYNLPIIYTTAYNDSHTIQEASDTNIYGYLIKPFKPSDLEAALLVTLKMLHKRDESQIIDKKQNEIMIDDYKYNLNNKALLKNEKPLELTNKEIYLVDVFFNNLNHNLSYDTLREKVWKEKSISDSTIRDTVSRLKKKVEGLSIENISKFGYVLKATQ